MPVTHSEKLSLIKHLNLNAEPSSYQGCFNFFTCTKAAEESQYEMGIENYSQNIRLPNAFRIDVNDLRTLKKAVKKIHDLNKKRDTPLTLRVAAGGLTDKFGNDQHYSQSWSLTPGIEADIVLRLTGKAFTAVNWSNKKDNTVWIGPSIQVGELHKLLEEKFGLVLHTASLIPFVTMGGLIANSCHGTGIQAHAMTKYIRAIEILKPDGSLVLIDRKHRDFGNIIGSNLGLFGVITRMELECMPAQKLKVNTKKFNFHDLIQDLEKNGSKGVLACTYPSIMWIPTFQDNETEPSCDKNIRVVLAEPVPLETPNVNYPAGGLNSACGQELLIQLSNLGTTDLLAAHPNLIPSFMKSIVAKVEVDGAPEDSIGPWVDQWHYQKAYPRDLADDDFSFPVKLNDVSRLILFLQRVSQLLKQYPNSIAHAIYIRFHKGFNEGLSPSICGDDEIIVAFDVVSSNKIPGYRDFRKAFQKMALDEFNAKPHPGKSLPEGISFAKMYGGNYTSFCDTVQRWYPVEKNPFINRMMGNILKEGITLVRSKICRTHPNGISPALLEPASLTKQAKIAEGVLKHISEMKHVVDDGLMENLHEIVLESKYEDQKPVYRQGLFQQVERDSAADEVKDYVSVEYKN